MDDKDGRVRDRAYAIWQEEGEPHGRDADHWHRAAAEADASSRPPAETQGEDPAALIPAAPAKAKKPRVKLAKRS